MILALLAFPAFAADEPCYGHTYDNRLSGTQFWVEWEDGSLPASGPQVILDAAEHAATVYRDDLGFPITQSPIVIAVSKDSSYGIGGLTRTQGCSDGPHPRIELFVGNYDATSAEDVTSHEVGHAAQYGYMGAYTDSVTSWLWWMEGCATWMTPHADGYWTGWGHEADGYLSQVDLALQHGLEGFLDPHESDHMYGTTWVVESLAEYAGDEDVIRQTWAYGGPHSGEPIFFPDAVNGVGVDFDAFWAHHLASLPTRLSDRHDYVGDVSVKDVIAALPSDGSTDGPQGFGVEIVQFPTALGAKKDALAVTFDGDPSVPWHVVVVRTTGDDVIDYVPLDVDASGHAEGWITGFYRVQGWLVASPEAPDTAAHAFAWHAELEKDPGAMDGAVVLGVAPDVGGCDHTGGSGGAAVGIAVALLGMRARRR